MFTSHIPVPQKPIPQIKNDYRKFLSQKNFIYCTVLKRKVYLSKQPEALFSCKNQLNRVPYIFIAFNIIKKSKSISSRLHNHCKEYEILGLDINGDTIKVHLREEIYQKDKVLFFTTCFRKQKK